MLILGSQRGLRGCRAPLLPRPLLWGLRAGPGRGVTRRLLRSEAPALEPLHPGKSDALSLVRTKRWLGSHPRRGCLRVGALPCGH